MMRVTVIGAGLMGHGLAQVFAAGGHDVAVHDPVQAALDTLRDRIRANLRDLGEDEAAADRVTPSADLGAAVPFYGRQPRAEDVPRIRAPILLHYAELDTGVNEGWPAYEAALKANDKVYEAYIYPGVNHGFHNDSTPRYDQAAAELAWERTLAWFRKHLA